MVVRGVYLGLISPTNRTVGSSVVVVGLILVAAGEKLGCLVNPKNSGSSAGSGAGGALVGALEGLEDTLVIARGVGAVVAKRDLPLTLPRALVGAVVEVEGSRLLFNTPPDLMLALFLLYGSYNIKKFFL